MQQLQIAFRAAQVALAVTLGAGAAEAAFVTTSNPPDLFPVGSVFAGAAPICIPSGPLEGVCTSNQKQTNLSSTVSFSGGNEHVALDVVLTGDTSNPAATFSLPGTEDLTLLGRSDPYETGTFSIDVISWDVSGVFDGVPLELTLDPSGPNDGVTIVTEIGQLNEKAYLIDTTVTQGSILLIAAGVTTPLGPITTTLTAGVPEPSTWILMSAGFAGLGFASFRARRTVVSIA